MSEELADPEPLPIALPVAKPVARRPAKVKRRRTPIIGPLFSWDLVRLARRGQDARSRTILAVTLLLTLLVFTIVWFSKTSVSEIFFGTQQELDIKESARFAEQFSLTLLVAQMAVMVLLTPAYAAGSIAEEKERRTWQYLLATDLSNREIVLGKFTGRVVFLLGVMFAGLPILAITGLIGGVDLTFLIFGYFLTGSTVALLAAAGVTSAVYASTFRGAMFRAYGLAALYVFFGGGVYPLLSPVAILVLLHNMLDRPEWAYGCGFAYVAVQWTLTVIILWMGIARIRKVERRAPRRRRPDYDDEERRPRRRTLREMDDDLRGDERRDVERREDDRRGEEKRGEEKRDEDRWGEADHRTRRRRHRSPEWADKPRIGNRDPFWWKEKYTLGTKRTVDDESIRSLMVVVGVLVAVFLGFAVLIAVVAGIGSPRTGQERMAQLLVYAGMAGVFTHFLTMGPMACGTIIREKARLTLESLLTIPVARTRILEPKWMSVFSKGWWWGGPGMICVVLGMLASDVGPVAFPTAVYLPAAAACCVSFGLLLSTRCTTIVRAVMIYMCLAGTLAILPMIIWGTYDERDKVEAVVVMAVAAVSVTAAAWLFWRQSVREFEQYGRN